MKQLLQSFKNGQTEIAEIPCPSVKSGCILIKTSASLISAGTERSLVSFGKASIISKARQQPEKVKMVLDKIKTDGLMTTFDAVKSKLDQSIPMGYCNVGRVVATQDTAFKIGYRVISNGSHAEVVRVPKNLCARIPDNVSDETAAFTVIASIALQGIRLANPTIGETVVVAGLGLVGLLSVQILKASGCKVIALDYNAERLKLAKQYGALTINLEEQLNPVESVITLNNHKEIDAVLVTAATQSSEPMHHAAQMSRKRGRIILVGVTGLELNRADFYEKELTFQVSCSYGPGRYDDDYEQKGQDYPVGFVRWTEQRNFEAVLLLMAEGKINIAPLVSHQFDFEEAEEAYSLLSSKESSLGILLKYKNRDAENICQTSVNFDIAKTIKPTKVVLGVIGAGNYAGRMLLPAFDKTSAQFHTIATSSGINAHHYGKKFKFQSSTTDLNTVWDNKDISTVAIATQHNTHAKFVVDALKSNKNVFVEKPLCLNLNELDLVAKSYQESSDNILMVGFNRRFSPLTGKMKKLLYSIQSPKSFIMTVNAGYIPNDHWTQNRAVGGGRIIGEACHFIDLLRYLCGSKISDAKINYLTESGKKITDTAIIMLTFEDGSIGTIQYLANGDKAISKERLEVFSAGKVLQLDNFRVLKGFGFKGFKKLKLPRQDKGQTYCVKAFVDAIENGKSSPIPFSEILEVSRVTIELADQGYC